MADPFSLAASAFAVLGAVDVVLRASVACCHFLSEIRDAPNEIRDLHSRIEENKLLIEAFKKHLDGIKDITITSATPTMTEALKLFESSTNSFKRELSALGKLGDKYTSKRKIWSATKYHLDDRKVSRCLRNLENAKTGLCAALSLVDSVPTLSHQQFIEKGVERVVKTTETLRQDMTLSCQRQVEHLRIQEKVLLKTERHLGISEALSKNLGQHVRVSPMEHKKTRETIAASSKLVIDVIQDSLANFRIGMSVDDSHGQELFSIGASHETLIELLILMKTQIQSTGLLEAARTLDVDWLQDEFKALVTSALQKNLDLRDRSDVFPSENWMYPSRALLKSVLRETTELPTNDQPNRGTRKMVNRTKNNLDQRETMRFESEWHVHISSIGKIFVNVPSSSTKSPYLKEARILFIPSADVSKTYLTVRFSRNHLPEMKPTLYTQLRAFRVVETWGGNWQIMSQGTIQQVDSAIREGSMSPYDQFPLVNVFFHAVGAYLRLDLLRYLTSQGLRISSADGEGDVLIGMYVRLQHMGLEPSDEDSLGDILALLDQHADRPTTPERLHFVPVFTDPHTRAGDMRARMIQRLLEFAWRRGYNLDYVAPDGLTPLLSHLRSHHDTSLATARALLKLGANPHATDLDNQNGIQLAMWSNVALHDDRKSRKYSWAKFPDMEEFCDMLQAKFELLIRAGVNLEHRDGKGSTLSQTARDCNCWEIWSKALKQCGKPVEEVVYEQVD